MNFHIPIGGTEVGDGGMEVRMERVEHSLFGNGQPGLDRVTRDFIAEWRGVERERQEAARRNNRSWNLRILAITAGFAAVELASRIWK